MSSTKEELRTLADQVPSDKTERALKFLRHLLHGEPENDQGLVSGQDDPMRQLIRQHWRHVGDRIGLDLDRLPKNGGMSGGVSGDRVELTKDWESEGARHRLSKLDVQGNEVIILERMGGNDSELRYEVQIFTEESEARAEVNVPIR